MTTPIFLAAVATLVGFVSLVYMLTTGIVNFEAKLEKSHSSMKAQMSRLHTIRSSVETKFRIYWFPRVKFDLWLKAVDEIEVEVKKLERRFSNIEHATFLSTLDRIKLTEAIDARCTEIDKILGEGKELEDALEKTDSRRVVELDPQISIENITSLMEILNDLLKCLENEKINTIRLHSIAGGGEGVLIRHLNNHKKALEMFDIILWISTSDFEIRSQENSIEVGIQRIVAKRLGLCINEGIEDTNDVASKIRDQLAGANYLLLLDNVKVSSINLQTIGIPSNTGGSKIVYTTNFPVFPFRIFSPHPEEFFNISMGKLDIDDSWQLFEDIFGNKKDVILKNDIEPIAFKVVKWCDGVFSVIKAVATYFIARKVNDESSWHSNLEKLQRPPTKGEIYMQALNNFWNFSYDSLEERQKICFLFCVLYPKGNKIPIDCLFDCWAANDLLQIDFLGQQILGCLLENALLESSDHKQYVTIDKVFWEVAMKILQEHGQYKCLVAEKALEELKNNNCLDIHWISLTNSEIDVLPDPVECPKLTTLFLQKNSKLKSIPSSFFKRMSSLLILDLCKTGSELVLPMNDLKGLKVLYVNGCTMSKELPFKIEGLDKLEVLDIRGCIINEIPDGIKKLKKLRRLLVSIDRGNYCGTLGCLKIDELSSLQELIIDVKSNVYHIDQSAYMSWCNKVIGDIITKINTFNNLVAFKVHFKDHTVDVIEVMGDTIRVFVPERGFLDKIWGEGRNHVSNAQVYIGNQMTSFLKIPKFFRKHYASFILSCDMIAIDTVIEDVLAKVEALIMINDDSLEHLDRISITHRSMHHIDGCFVHNCNKIKTLLCTHGFSNLKTLVLSECSQLNVLFSNDVLGQVMSIEHLEIRDCPGIKEINMVSTCSGDVLPTLKTLVLHNLKMLTKICPGLEWPSLITMEIHQCPLLKEISLNLINAKNLRHIKVEERWWGNLQLLTRVKQRFNVHCKFCD